jgi:hypothetical protein
MLGMLGSSSIQIINIWLGTPLTGVGGHLLSQLSNQARDYLLGYVVLDVKLRGKAILVECREGAPLNVTRQLRLDWGPT